MRPSQQSQCFLFFFREIFDMVASERRLPIYRAQRLDGHFDDWEGVGCVRPTFPKKINSGCRT